MRNIWESRCGEPPITEVRKCFLSKIKIEKRIRSSGEARGGGYIKPIVYNGFVPRPVNSRVNCVAFQ